MLGELEQKIMDIIWKENRAVSVTEVKEKLGGNLAYTTVMTITKRLYDKKLLSRELHGKVYFYSPIKDKSEVAQNTLKKLFSRILNSYGDLAITNFVDTIKSDKKSLKEISNLINKYIEKQD